MAEKRVRIDGRKDSSVQLAYDWMHRLDHALGLPAGDVPVLYRWTDSGPGSVVNDDRSITLRARTAQTMAVVAAAHYNSPGHDPGETSRNPLPVNTADDLQDLRAAVADFGDTYLELVQPADTTLGRAARALDVGVRANTVDITSILTGMHNLAENYLEAGGIESQTGPDRHPLLQGAAAELTERVSRRVGMRPGEVNRLLRTVPPAGRFKALATLVVEGDIRQRRLPDGTPRHLPRDHTDRLKDIVAADLEAAFDELGRLDPQNRRDRGERMVEGAMQNVAGFLREPVRTEQPAYQQVTSLMSAVQSELSQTRAPGIGVATLHLKFNTDYWSGELHGSAGEGAGAAGSDRSLTFDQNQVIDMLEAADTSTPPSAEVRSAVHTVGVQAARLCNPEEPGRTELDSVGQALDDQLTNDFATRQEPQLLAALGYGPEQLAGVGNPEAPTTTAQVVAAVTANAGRGLGLEPHEAATHLLTTAPNERLDRAVAMSLDGVESAVGREVREQVTRTLNADLRSVLDSAVDADQGGKSRMRFWPRSTGGEELGQKVDAAVEKARKALAGPVANKDDLQRTILAATAGQAPPGGSRPGTQGPTTRQQQTSHDSRGPNNSGRG
ncbi:hypothetical protein [Kribbella solani]|uniref:hypothetical protein n=1 Tax=Kribbella solani TaxID=236067 RepID=UPI0029BCA25B|nr:hypothetical protein [Kribbella solani]MDX2968359.1 hypothetical protein [Kribbella solani]